jgi:hypothetical protein
VSVFRATLLLMLVAMPMPVLAAEQGTCSFAYTEKIRDEIAAPLIVRQNGGFILYDFDNPSVKRVGNKVHLFFFQLDNRKVPNLMVGNPPYWEIELDACTLEVIASYQVSEIAIEGPGIPGITPPRASP